MCGGVYDTELACHAPVSRSHALFNHACAAWPSHGRLGFSPTCVRDLRMWQDFRKSSKPRPPGPEVPQRYPSCRIMPPGPNLAQLCARRRNLTTSCEVPETAFSRDCPKGCIPRISAQPCARAIKQMLEQPGDSLSTPRSAEELERIIFVLQNMSVCGSPRGQCGFLKQV